MRKLGLKLWSINENYLVPARELFERGVYDYIELYSVPGSFEKYRALWKTLKIPFIIHAPHFDGGLNFAIREKEASNLALATEAQKWADTLNAAYIIFHPGIGGDIKETARQINMVNDMRILVENKPYNIRLGPEVFCNGYNPKEIKYVLDNTGAGFCFDVGHCFCAANSMGANKWKYMEEFLSFKPEIIHVSDGNFDAKLDEHRNLGMGNYDFKKIFSALPSSTPLSIETEKKSKINLKDYECDAVYIKDNLWRFTFRPAQENDMEATFELANDPEVRANSFNTAPITRNEHESWFNAKINNPASLFFIIKEDDVFAGYVRFENGENALTVSVALAQKTRGRGLAAGFIKHTSFMAQNHFKEPVKAYIKSSNLSSATAFKKAGYIEKGITKHKNQSCMESVLPYEI